MSLSRFFVRPLRELPLLLHWKIRPDPNLGGQVNGTNVIKGVMDHESEKVTNRYMVVPKDDEMAALNMLSLSDFLPQQQHCDSSTN